MNQRCLLSGAACAAILVMAAPGFAAAQQRDHEVEGVVVTGQLRGLQVETEGASRLDLTPMETPASVEVISGEVVRERGEVSVQDAAARTAGIVNTSGVFGYGLAARGFTGQNSVMQLFDGMRMYNNTLTFPSDPWMAERIEILRGPASVLYGEGAIGGAINVVRRRPTTTFEAGGQVSGAEFGAWRVAGGAGGPVGDYLSYRVDGAYRQSDGWMERGESSGGAFGAAVDFKATDTLRLSLSYDFSDQHPRTWFGTPRVGNRLRADMITQNYNVGDAKLHFEDNWTQAKALWTPSDSLTVQATLYKLWATKYWHNAENVAYAAPTLLLPERVVRSSYLELYHLQDQTGLRVTGAYKESIAGKANNVVVGFDANDISYTNVSNSGNTFTDFVSTTNPTPGVFKSTTPTIPRYTNTIRQYAIFAEDRLVLGEKVSIVGGVRYDHPEITKRDYVVAANNFTRTPGATTWRLGVVYNPVPNTSLYAQHATAADPVGALVSTSLAQSTFQLSTGRQWEAGWKQLFWGSRGQFTLAAYDIVKNNLLTSDPLNPTIQIQVGQQSSRGVEASLIVEPLEGVTVNLNGSLLDAQYDDFMEGTASRAGNVPTNVAEETANLHVAWRVNDRWSVDTGVSYVGDRYQNAANTVLIPAYASVDAGVRWNATERASLSLRVRNLSDRAFVRSTYGANQFVLGDPRTVELTLDARF